MAQTRDQDRWATTSFSRTYRKNIKRWVCLIVVDNIQYYELHTARPLAHEPGCLGTGTATDMSNI